MKKLGITLIPLAATLAALPVTSEASVSKGPIVGEPSEGSASRVTPNTMLISDGQLLGFLVTQAADGTTIAQHASHASHSSHSSHASSSR